MPRALVTGASGFIGPFLVRRLLAAGWDVTCLVRPTSSRELLERLGVRLTEGNVNDPPSLDRAVAEVDYVVHAAGVIKALSARAMETVNARGTAAVADACARRETPPALVLVSSLAAVGPAPPERPRNEADPPAPVSVYGKSKRAGEIAAERHAGHLPVTVVRPPIVFGQGDRELYMMFQPIARYGIHAVPSLSDWRFSLIHAEDLAELTYLAAVRGKRVSAGQEPGRGQGYYFPAYEDHPTYAELGRMIGRSLGRTHTRIWRTPQQLAWGVGLLGELLGRVRGKPLIVNLDKIRESNAGSWACDARRARDELGFAPEATLAQRLQQTAQWYREHGWL